MDKKSLRTYRIWKAMKSRCYAPSTTKGYYHSDHITVCDRWLHSYENFMADMGEPTCENPSIERLDYKGNYCPENCIWIDQHDQPKNRRNCLVYTHDGKTMNLKDWSREIGMNYDTLRGRIVKQGMSFEKAISLPVKSNKI